MPGSRLGTTSSPPLGRCRSAAGREPGSGAKVGEVAFGCARADADARRGVRHGSARRDEGGEDVDLTGSSTPWQRSAEVAVPHACRLAAAIHSSRPSMGIGRLLSRAQHLSCALCSLVRHATFARATTVVARFRSPVLEPMYDPQSVAGPAGEPAPRCRDCPRGRAGPPPL